MVKSAYIHIPFCKSKCHYCSFVSFCDLSLKKDYLKTIAKEIIHFYEKEPLKTLYIGGGTPSLLDISEIENIIRIFNFEASPEITMELNPEDVFFDYMRGLYDVGINRISLGCQTFDDKILKLINRRHNSVDVINAVKIAQQVGFKNINLDFIYGLPDQSQDMFYSDLKKAIELDVPHISLYGLKLEQGSYFYSNLPENLPDDDEQADMYISAVELLTSSGFEHYEISNFSLDGYNSQHNLNYWNNNEYYGFGVAAHGYKNGVRYGNKEDISSYLLNPIEKRESKILSIREILEEEIFLGLRRMKGINISDINFKYGINFLEKYNDILKKYEGLNLLTKTEEGYAFTINGILVSNVILADFLDDSESD